MAVGGVVEEKVSGSGGYGNVPGEVGQGQGGAGPVAVGGGAGVGMGMGMGGKEGKFNEQGKKFGKKMGNAGGFVFVFPCFYVFLVL